MTPNDPSKLYWSQDEANRRMGIAPPPSAQPDAPPPSAPPPQAAMPPPAPQPDNPNANFGSQSMLANLPQTQAGVANPGAPSQPTRPVGDPDAARQAMQAQMQMYQQRNMMPPPQEQAQQAMQQAGQTQLGQTTQQGQSRWAPATFPGDGPKGDAQMTQQGQPSYGTNTGQRWGTERRGGMMAPPQPQQGDAQPAEAPMGQENKPPDAPAGAQVTHPRPMRPGMMRPPVGQPSVLARRPTPIGS
jgi:hypothetical protein